MRPSLLIIPANETPGILMPQIPFNGTVDFIVDRNTTARRVNSSGLIQSVASGVPRIDWLGQSCPGLLVEASGQNLVQRSEEFNDGYWSKVRCTASANQTTAPDGALTADKLIMNNGVSPTVADTDGILRNEVITSGAYRFSIFAKAAEFTGFKVRENAVNGNFMDVNLTNGAITNPDTAQFISPLAQNYGNGWYRISWTSPTITNLNKYSIRVGSTGNGTSGIFVWGAQVETGSVATTYIPTTSGTGSRAAETISASGVSGLIGQTEGTIYAEVDVRNLAIETYIIRIDEGASSNNITLRKLNTNQIRIAIVAPTASGTNISSAVFTAGIIKIAFAYKSGEIALSVNGATPLTANGTFAFGASLNRITLGSNQSAGSEFNDRIRAVALYTTRLPNDDLIRLTLPSRYVTYNDMALGLAYTIK